MLCFLELHSYTSTYTGVAGIPKLPVFTAVTRVDGLELHYFDSNKNEHILKQDWMKTVEFKPVWKEISAYHDEVYRQLKETFDVKKKSYNKTGVCFLFLQYYTVYVFFSITFTDNRNIQTHHKMFSQVSLKLSPPHTSYFCFRYTYVPVDMPLSVGRWNWTYI